MLVFLRNTILGILLTVLMTISFLGWAIHSPRCWQWILKKSLTHSLKTSGVVLKEIKVAHPRWNENVLRFDKISGWIVHQHQTYHLQVKQMTVDGLKSLIGNALINIDFQASEMNVNSASMNVNVQDFYFESTVERSQLKESLPFRLKMSGLKFNEYNCSALKGKGSFTHQQININDFQADCYDGKIAAQWEWSYVKMLAFQLHVDFDDVNLKELEKINRNVFDKIHGRIAGDLMVKGDKNGTAEFESTIKILSGGEIQATLFEPLLAYIPQSVQRKDLEGLIKKKGQVPVEKAVIQLKRVADEKLSSTVILESKKMNLNTNVALDINVEGGIKNLYSHLIEFLNKGGSYVQEQ